VIDPSEAAVLAMLAFFGALIFGITGFGSGLITIPLATHFVPLKFALALYVLTDLASAVRLGLENPKNAVRSEWTRLVPMILLGTALGVTLLVNLPRAAGMLLLGTFILAYVAYTVLKSPRQRTVSPRWAWVAGLCGGLTSTLFGAGGPPYAIYLSQRGLTKEQFRATMGFATMTSISLRVVAFLLTGLLLDLRIWLVAVFAVPAALLGILTAQRLFQRISREMLLRAVTLLLALTGASLVGRALL
jgi:uncharacterized membrane protein YfcA